MIVNSSGYVGIGTTSLGGQLHIKNNFTTQTNSLVLDAYGQLRSKAKIHMKSIGAGGGYMSSYISQGYNGSQYYIGMGGDSNGYALLVTNGGRVGIGTLNPSAKVEINGTGTKSFNTGAYGRLASTGASKNSTSSYDHNLALSLHTTGHIFAQNTIYSSSDRRIKKDIEEINDDQSLQNVRNINCCSYKYIDHIERGGGIQVGFIAQQVREHFPEAVSTRPLVIPNEMRNLEDISWNGTDMSCDLSDVSGVKYRFYVSTDLSGNDEEMKDIIGNEDNTFTFDASYNYVFCYGKEVDDFHTLDKLKLFALNFSATQEIDRIQQKQLLDISGNTIAVEANKVEIELLKLKNEELKLENEELTNKVTSLETELNNLKTIVESLVNNN